MADHPDWGRFGIAPPNKYQPVGDPTRWGVSLDTLIPATGLVDTPQILQIQTRDPYSRAWSIFGTLTMTAELWGTGAGVDIDLDMVMGVGQAQITQRLVLFNGTGVPATATALCEAQYLPNGGVYAAISGPALGAATRQTRAFAAVGAVIGQSINIRARYNIAGVFATLPQTTNLSLIVAPYAAGQGL
jgi:hypothetical protein